MSRYGKPLGQAKADGSYREDRHGQRVDDRYPTGAPPRPEMGEIATRLWDDITRITPAEVLVQFDWAALKACCEWYEVASKLRQQVTADPLDGRTLRSAAQAEKTFLSLATRFGLTPVDRTRIKAIKPERKDDSPMAKLLQITAAKTG